MKRAAFLVIPMVVFFVCGCGKTSPSAGYSVVSVNRGVLVSVISATGTLNPLITVKVGSQVSGTIQHLYADFNDRVKEGDVVAVLEPSLFDAEVAKARANLESAEAAREKAQVAVRDTARSLDRLERLQKSNVVAERDLDAARFAFEAAQVEQQVREAEIAQAVATLRLAEVNRAHATIYAPIDGVVISRDVDVGQTVAASLQAPTLFTIAQDLAEMQIETDVDEAFIGQVHEGQPVAFTVFAFPNREFRGEVSQVRLNPKVEAGVVKYNCVIRVRNKDGALKPGMTATVSIEVERREEVLRVPNAALRFVADYPEDRLAELKKRLEKGQSVLWAVAETGLSPVVVQTGLVGERETEVRGEGVVEGMKIAVPLTKKNGAPKRRGFRIL